MRTSATIRRTGQRADAVVLGLVGALGGFTSATALATAASPAAPPACTAGTLVQTQDGPVCGLVGNGVTSYLGIRFAAPPVGALRLATTGASNPVDDNAAGHPGGAQLPTANLSGIDSAHDQRGLSHSQRAGADERGVGSAAGDGRGPRRGFLLGGPPDQSHLAATGHVIAVGIHYRLGILGLLAHEGLGAHSGDYGLQDQQAALRWVKRNIAASVGTRTM